MTVEHQDREEHQDGDAMGQESHAPLIELHRVVKIFESGAGDVIVLKDISLRIDPGEYVSIVGPSGSGKSTLLNMITGIDRPTTGQIYVAGQAIHTLNENQLAKWRGVHLGVVFQFFQLLPTLTVIENVILPMDFCNTVKRRERRKRALGLLDRVGLIEHADKLPSALSGGEQQRVAIARALANDPPLIVADEPTGNLDTATANEIFQLFDELVAEGKTIVLVTHDRELSARAQRVVQIQDGRIVRDERTAPEQALTDRAWEQVVGKFGD